MGSIADLKTTLTNTIAAFNIHDMPGVQAVMAPGFTVVSVNPQAKFGPKTTPLTATQELNAQGDATFQLIDPAVFAPPAGDAANAQITGQATWTDPNNPNGEKIQFRFNCVFDPIQKKWLFQDLSAGVIAM